MEKMEVAKATAVKMKGEDLAHAYDAVRVANKSVYTLANFPFGSMLRFTFDGWTSPLVCQVSGGPAALPAQSEGGRDGGSEEAA